MCETIDNSGNAMFAAVNPINSDENFLNKVINASVMHQFPKFIPNSCQENKGNYYHEGGWEV